MGNLAEKYDLSRFDEGCSELGLVLSEKQKEQLLLYYEMLVEKNKVMNLTAVTEFQDVLLLHYLDSFCLVNLLRPEEKESFLDLGTGAGFPGVPLKILFPACAFTLADSLNKRVNFLQEVIGACGLEDIQAVHGRAEDLARQAQYRQQYTYCLSRAVAPLNILAEYCLPFVKKGGAFISYKSNSIDEEIANAGKAISLCGGKLETVVHYDLPGTDIPRTLVCIRKEKDTPAVYPRKAGTPSKKPL